MMIKITKSFLVLVLVVFHELFAFLIRTIMWNAVGTYTECPDTLNSVIGCHMQMILSLHERLESCCYVSQFYCQVSFTLCRVKPSDVRGGTGLANPSQERLQEKKKERENCIKRREREEKRKK